MIKKIPSQFSIFSILKPFSTSGLLIFFSKNLPSVGCVLIMKQFNSLMIGEYQKEKTYCLKFLAIRVYTYNFA